MATPREKVVALRGRAAHAASSAGTVLDWARRALRYLDDPDLQVTSQQSDRLIARYTELRGQLLDAAARLPENPQTWEPDPSEYEEAP